MLHLTLHNILLNCIFLKNILKIMFENVNKHIVHSYYKTKNNEIPLILY